MKTPGCANVEIASNDPDTPAFSFTGVAVHAPVTVNENAGVSGSLEAISTFALKVPTSADEKLILKRLCSPAPIEEEGKLSSLKTDSSSRTTAGECVSSRDASPSLCTLKSRLRLSF